MRAFQVACAVSSYCLVVIAAFSMACEGPPGKLADGEPPRCEHEASPGARFRLFAVGHKVTLDEAENAQAYEAAIRATVARDVVPHLAQDRPNVLVFPESVALSALLLGPRGAAARQESTAQGALTTLLQSYLDEVTIYARHAPDAGPGRLLMLAATDPLWRAFDGTFSRLARDHGVYVAAGVDVGDVEIATDPEIIEVLGDPDRPPDAPVYWVPDGKVYNQVIFYGPDGGLIGRIRKEYLTDLELVDLDLEGGLPERLGPVDLDGLMRAAAMVSRDAWMQDALERQALRGANVLMQNEAYAGGWVTAPAGYGWPPDNLKRSGWAAAQKYPEFRVAVAPMLVGNFFDVVFDGQSFAVIPGEPGHMRRSLAAQVPDTGWAAMSPWVEEPPMSGTLEEQRAFLRAIGESLRPGGERDNQYVAGSVYVDVDIPADDGYAVLGDARPGAEEPILGTSSAIAPSNMGRQRHAAPVMMADKNMVVAWEDTRFCTSQVMVASSHDGQTWTLPVRVQPWNRPQRTPSMVVTPRGELILAWQEVLDHDRAEIRVARSSDAGATWSPAWRIDEANTMEAWKPSLAVDPANGDVYLAFVDRRSHDPGRANWRIHVTHSRDGARSWSPPARVDPRERSMDDVDPTYTNEWTPAVAARDGHVVVAYTHRERPDPAEQPSHDVFAIKSQDRGVTWDAPVRLDQGGFPERLSGDVVVSMSSDHGFRVLWSSLRGTGPDTDIALASGTELAFAPDTVPARDQWFPSIAELAGDAWVVAWQDLRNGSNDVYLARLNAQGFGPALRVDDAGPSAAQAWRPRVAAHEDGTVLVVWEDSRTGHAEIRVASGMLP